MAGDCFWNIEATWERNEKANQNDNVRFVSGAHIADTEPGML